MGRPERRLNSKADLQQAGSQPLGLVALRRRWRPWVDWRDFEAVGVRKAMFFLSVLVSISLAIPSSSFLSFKMILASDWDIILIWSFKCLVTYLPLDSSVCYTPSLHQGAVFLVSERAWQYSNWVALYKWLISMTPHFILSKWGFYHLESTKMSAVCFE